jgi:hypothetical protein
MTRPVGRVLAAALAMAGTWASGPARAEEPAPAASDIPDPAPAEPTEETGGSPTFHFELRAIGDGTFEMARDKTYGGGGGLAFRLMWDVAGGAARVGPTFASLLQYMSLPMIDIEYGPPEDRGKPRLAFMQSLAVAADVRVADAVWWEISVGMGWFVGTGCGLPDLAVGTGLTFDVYHSSSFAVALSAGVEFFGLLYRLALPQLGIGMRF